uniref:Uncharacterized protein n=1 Tax=Triticum urartu TaxID=4572 RepID=A0A8R7QET0_TRIUA
MSMAESNIHSTLNWGSMATNRWSKNGDHPLLLQFGAPRPPFNRRCRRCLLTASPGRAQAPTSPTTRHMFGQQAVVQLGLLLLLHAEPWEIMVFSHSLVNNICTVGMRKEILYCLEKDMRN